MKPRARSLMPKAVVPMLATRVAAPFDDSDWSWEPKVDDCETATLSPACSVGSPTNSSGFRLASSTEKSSSSMEMAVPPSRVFKT